MKSWLHAIWRDTYVLLCEIKYPLPGVIPWIYLWDIPDDENDVAQAAWPNDWARYRIRSSLRRMKQGGK